MLKRNSLRDSRYRKTASYVRLMREASPIQRDILAGLAESRGRSPWEERGVLLRTIRDASALDRLYVMAGGWVEGSLAAARKRARTATRWRMASAIIEESSWAPECPACDGEGVLPGEIAVMAHYCDVCGGTGRRGFQPSRRADMCGCHHTDFRDRLVDVYERALLDLANAEWGVLALARRLDVVDCGIAA